MKIIQKIKRKFFGINRYQQLYSYIKTSQPAKILEIGLWNGNRAKKMIETAIQYSNAKDIHYYGFDLFESLPEDEHNYEHAKKPLTLEQIKNKLQETGANITLFKGNTNDTLASSVTSLPPMDFIFIDGGHSLETIDNDWNYCSKLMHAQTIVIFDDYWETLGSGAKKLVDNLDPQLYETQVLPIKDISNRPERKTISFALVKKRSASQVV